MVNIFEQEDELELGTFKIVRMEEIFNDSQQFFVNIRRFLGTGPNVREVL